MKPLFLSVFLTLTLLQGFTQQEQNFTLTGTVYDEFNQPIPYALVILDSSEKKLTNINGEYSFPRLKKGDHTLDVKVVGFDVHNETISLQKDLHKNIVLQESTKNLHEVIVTSQSESKTIKNEGYSVEIIKIDEYQETKPDVNEVLQEVPGVVIRQSGGLGSNFDISLNGMSGKRVKFFIDNIPLETFGSSFSLNNYPVNLIKTVDVYKGVVPIHFGADALGGAVNITTNKVIKDYINATYSYGSFNTHRTGIMAQKVIKKDIFFKLSTFYNYSDNNYWMDDLPTTDEFGNINGTIRRRRFHDQYRSSMVKTAVGTGYKKWASHFEFGLVYSSNKNDVQHDLSLLRPYGVLDRSNQVTTSYLKYKKDSLLLDNLSLDLFSSFGKQQTSIADTSSKRFNWLGEYIIREDPTIGETSNQKSLFNFQDQIVINQVNLKYSLKKYQEIQFNFTQNYIQRTGEDPISNGVIPFKDPHTMNKVVWGLSHKSSYNKNKGISIIFAKAYQVKYNITQSDFSGNETRVNSTRVNYGFGTAQSYQLTKPLRIKISYENAYRIPDPYEIFGDGLNLKANTFLLPENSHNLNSGISLEKSTQNVEFLVAQHFFLRYAKNYIYIESIGPFARYTNKNNVNISGSETSFKIKFKKWLSIHSNVTYQNIIDGDKPFGNNTAKNRIANIPYLFGSLNFGFHKLNINKKPKHISLYFTGLFREEFYLISPGEGNPKHKNIIPQQTSVNTSFNYSWKNNRYGITFSVNNLFDQKLYDNFRIQKPGRAYTIKLKYSLTKK